MTKIYAQQSQIDKQQNNSKFINYQYSKKIIIIVQNKLVIVSQQYKARTFKKAMLRFQQKHHFHSISQFHIFKNKLLGNGSFGNVYLVTHILTCKMYALKIINLNKITNSTEYKLIQKQNRIHIKLDHYCIVKLWDSFVEDGNIYMIMDYIENGSLFYYQNARTIFPQLEAFKYFYQTLQAIKYLHNNNIMHRDIKPQNLLIDHNYNIKLCDFGWATLNIEQKRTTFCGTYQYMAPQMLFQRAYDYKIDIWALGILLYQLLHGFAPFKGQSINQVKHKMKIGEYYLNNQVSNQCKQLIICILKFQPQERISIQQIERNKWVKKMERLLMKYYIQNQNSNITSVNTNNNSVNNNINIKVANTNKKQNKINKIINKYANDCYLEPNLYQQSQILPQQQHTESTSTNNYIIGQLDHTQSVMIIGNKNQAKIQRQRNTKDNNDREQLRANFNLKKIQNNVKISKVNLHKKTISATTFGEVDRDQFVEGYQTKKKQEKQSIKQKQKLSEFKDKNKFFKSKKQKQQLIKNITATKNQKNTKKKPKNLSQLSSTTNNIFQLSSDNQYKLELDQSISQENSFQKQQFVENKNQIFTSSNRLKNKNYITQNIYENIGSKESKRCKTLASNDVNKKIEKSENKIKKQKTDKNQKDKSSIKMQTQTININNGPKKSTNLPKRKSQQHLVSTLQFVSHINELRPQTKSKSKSKSKFKRGNRHGRGYKDKNVASQPSLLNMEGIDWRKK